VRPPPWPATWAWASMIRLYDDNHITIDGGTPAVSFHVEDSCSSAYEAYGWHVQHGGR